MFGNRALRIISGPEEEEDKVGWEKKNNEIHY
jgi:hypothetical protein